MKSPNPLSQLADSKSRRSCIWSIFSTASLLCLMVFIGSIIIGRDFSEMSSRLGMSVSMQNSVFNNCEAMTTSTQNSVFNDSERMNTSRRNSKRRIASRQDLISDDCESQCRPNGSEALPKGIVVTSSDLNMRPLWGSRKKRIDLKKNLLAVAVGIKQKHLVDKMVQKFLSGDFIVMLFHYDGVLDEWKDFRWCDQVIHVAAINQTKWWFAKRFLHPEIVAQYNYIFLWDEDLGVEGFNPQRYIETVEKEGLEISQPALDGNKSEVHHQITIRGRRSNVHRRTFKAGSNRKFCDENSTAPPCTGFIELMAPVFSREAWRCVWYMVQNDLIHAWGLDMLLGYCAQGDRTKNVGVVDLDYIVHYGIPTLGANELKATPPVQDNDFEPEKLPRTTTAGPPMTEPPTSLLPPIDYRIEVRRQSYQEYRTFRRRWKVAVRQDKCWKDPYRELEESNNTVFYI